MATPFDFPTKELIEIIFLKDYLYDFILPEIFCKSGHSETSAKKLCRIF